MGKEKKALLILCPEDSLQYYRTLLAFNKNLVAVLEHSQLGCFPLVFWQKLNLTCTLYYFFSDT